MKKLLITILILVGLVNFSNKVEATTFPVFVNGNTLTSTTVALTQTISATVNAGSNELLVVYLWIQKYSPQDMSVISVTYNGTALTEVEKFNSIDSFGSYLGYIVNPTTGTNNLVITSSSGNLYHTYGGYAVYSGVDQTTPADTGASSHGYIESASVTTLTLALTTTGTNELIFSYIRTEVLQASKTPGTQRVTNNHDGTYYEDGWDENATSTTAYNVTFTQAVAGVMAASGFAIVPLGGGAPPASVPPTRTGRIQIFYEPLLAKKFI